MAAEPKAMIHRWFDEVWNQGRLETIDELFAEESVAHGLGEGGRMVRGPAAFKPLVQNLRAAMPDLHIGVEDIVVDGDRAAFRVVLQGTHTGDGLGVPPSGRPVRVAGMVMVRFENGRIMEGWNSWDQLGLLQQIGAVPEPGREDRFLSRA